MYKIVFTRQAVKDAKKIKACGLDRKAKELIAILEQDPFQVPPPYEKLVGNLSGFYSRRINLQHRLVYQVLETPDVPDAAGYVKLVRLWTHYE